MQPDAHRKPDRSSVESAIMGAIGDMHVLDIVVAEASESPRNDAGERPVIMVCEDTFLAWMRACNHLAYSVREAERVFYEAKL